MYKMKYKTSGDRAIGLIGKAKIRLSEIWQRMRFVCDVCMYVFMRLIAKIFGLINFKFF
jgi:hypothetical protein